MTRVNVVNSVNAVNTMLRLSCERNTGKVDTQRQTVHCHGGQSIIASVGIGGGALQCNRAAGDNLLAVADPAAVSPLAGVPFTVTEKKPQT